MSHKWLFRAVIGLSIIFLQQAPANAEAPPDTLPAALRHALDGMAPEGRWAARLTVLGNGYDQRYDNAGRRVDLSGMPGLDTRVSTDYTELMFGYGVTENLTLGAIVPYTRSRTRVRFSPGAEAPLQAMASALGYNRLRTTVSSGFSDPTLGALWRFHKSADDSALVGIGVRLGVAADDDPKNLVDVPPGDGSTDLRTRMEYFRDLGSGFDLRLLAEYQAQLPDEVTLRWNDTPTSVAEEKLKRDLGNYWEYDVEVGKSIGDWRVAATWHRYREPADRYTSRLGTDTRALSANTDTLADQYRIGITWSGVNAWRARKLPMPLIVKLELQDAFDGRNFVKVRDFYLRLTSFF